MNPFVIIMFSLPFILLCTLFIGIVKRNKRLWITSLIFFIVITLAEITFFVPIFKTQTESCTQKTNSTD